MEQAEKRKYLIKTLLAEQPEYRDMEIPVYCQPIPGGPMKGEAWRFWPSICLCRNMTIGPWDYFTHRLGDSHNPVDTVQRL